MNGCLKLLKLGVICYTIENSSMHCLSSRNNQGKEAKEIISGVGEGRNGS